MKALLQRVTHASVRVDEQIIGQIGNGLVVLVGVESTDTFRDIEYLTDKISNLRIFSDADGKFNLSLTDVGGEVLVVSQFTLLASTRKGRRPSFTDAAPPDQAEALVEAFAESFRSAGFKVETGKFQAHMLLKIHHDGPVTISLDSKDRLIPRRK